MSQSPLQKVLNRFFKNKIGVASLVFICLCMLTALLGYGLTPDDSPAANQQQAALPMQAPGFDVLMLKKKIANAPFAINFFEKICYGQPVQFTEIPIKNNYQIRGDSLFFEQIVALNRPPKPQQLSLLEITEGKLVESAKQLNAVKSAPVTTEKLLKIGYIYKKKYPLGTDGYGRCVLSRLIIGARMSLSVGLAAVLLSLLIGVSLGAVAGYFGRWVDALVLWLANTLWAVPTLLFVFALVLALGRGYWQIFVAIGLTMWVDSARLVRGLFFSQRELGYVEAARSMGFSHGRIIFRHILPNCIGSISVVAATNFAAAILVESGLM